jgi:hypothetical protein
MLSKSNRLNPLSANCDHQGKFETQRERDAISEYWRNHGLDILKERNPTYSECKAAAIGNQTANPELAADLMVKAKKYKKPKSK